MSDELKKNYEIFTLSDLPYQYVVLRRFCHSIAQQNAAIEKELNDKGYQGWVLFDNLFKGGNTKFRYGRQYFDKTFNGPLLKEEIALSSPIREMVSRYLRENNYAIGTSLTEKEIEDIMNGRTI